MKAKIFLALIMAISSLVNAQHIVNLGGSIVMDPANVMVIRGDFTNLQSGTMVNNGLVLLNGDWTNNAGSGNLLQGSSGTVSFDGASVQNINGPAKTWFNNLEINNAVNILAETSVASELNLTGGSVNLGDADLSLESGATISGAGPTQYIVAGSSGRLVQQVHALDVLFPVGTAASYLPAIIKNSGTVDYFGVNVFNDVLDGGTSGISIPEIDDCVNNTWNITEETAGGSNINVEVQWNALDEGPNFDRSQSGIGYFTDGAWSPQDAAAASGADPYTLTRNGISTMGAIAVGDNNSPMVLNISYNEQDIFLTQGWSGLSSYIQPVDPAIQEIMAPVVNELIILQNQLGMYWPMENINTLGNWNTHSGYKIKMSGDIQLTITGTVETNTTLNLFAGWNLIPVISNCAVDVATLFESTSIVLVKEIAGTAIYWPDFGMNTLTTLLPGRAYMVLMNSDEDVVFPACSQALSNAGNEGEEITNARLMLKEASAISGKAAITTTPNSHTIAIPISAFHGIDITYGDVLQAMDEEGNCYGLAQWFGEDFSISLFGDDQTTIAKDGFGDGTTISFRLFQSDLGQEITLDAIYNNEYPDNDGRFTGNGLSVVSEFKLSPTGIGATDILSQIEVYPNPAKDDLNLIFENAEITEGTRIELLNSVGSVVLEQDILQKQTRLDIQHIQPGMYVLKIFKNGSYNFRKVIIQ